MLICGVALILHHCSVLFMYASFLRIVFKPQEDDEEARDYVRLASERF